MSLSIFLENINGPMEEDRINNIIECLIEAGIVFAP